MNFLKSLLESIEYDLLLQEGRDPVEVLHYKFQNKVPGDIIDKVISIDPTKKKSYSQWLLSKWDNEQRTIIDGLKSGRIEKLFQHMKEHKDVQLQAYDTIEEPLEAFAAEEDTVLTKSDKPTTILMNRGWKEEVDSRLANDFDVVFNDDDWLIAVPNTYEADCKLGENMNWCTAGGRSDFNGGRSYYDHYLNSSGGKYYVNFDLSKGESRLGKDYPYTRYQFHFETKQFMDKDDESVELSEIGMPDSAIEFYEEQGYDSSDFENLEVKMERYDVERYNVSYRINDDLYLCIEYDEDYEFIEPEDDTDFYLFCNGDDRDPISYEAIENPHTHDNVVVDAKGNYVIVRKNYDKNGASFMLAIAEENNWGYGAWETYDIGKYLPIENLGIFTVTDDKKFTFLPKENEVQEFEGLNIENCESIFYNKACSETAKKPFIEVIGNGGYHSLFSINEDSTINCIIYKDYPINDKYYEINEQGLIDADFKSYRAYENNYYSNDDGYQYYQFVDTLPDGNYLVEHNDPSENGEVKTRYNVLNKDNKQPISKEWFNEYLIMGDNMYVVKDKEDLQRLLNKTNGEYLDKTYTRIKGLEHGSIIGTYFDTIRQANIEQLIDSYTGQIKAEFLELKSYKPINGMIIIRTLSNEVICYDYKENKICFPELKGFSPIGQKNGLYFCTVNNSMGVVFDLNSERIISKNVEETSNNIDGSYHNYFIRVLKTDGTQNIINENAGKEILPVNVQEIFDFNEYHKLVNFKNNDKYFIYNYGTNQFLINKEGIKANTKIFNSGNIVSSIGNIGIFFNPQGEFTHWREYIGNGAQYREGNNLNDKENTPQEVFQLYAEIFNTANAYTMAESFKQLLNRINEVKL